MSEKRRVELDCEKLFPSSPIVVSLGRCLNTHEMPKCVWRLTKAENLLRWSFCSTTQQFFGCCRHTSHSGCASLDSAQQWNGKSFCWALKHFAIVHSCCSWQFHERNSSLLSFAFIWWQQQSSSGTLACRKRRQALWIMFCRKNIFACAVLLLFLSWNVVSSRRWVLTFFHIFSSRESNV